MPYEDDYKMWLEKMLIEMNPDWVCDGMADKEFTRDWCEEYCGKDNAYIAPKCLHMYYHHIARADRKIEQTERRTDRDGDVWEWRGDAWYCISGDEPQTEISNKLQQELQQEPQTEVDIARTIVHKMIDNSEIAEDAYPNLRQKLHDAVDEYEPQTDCAWK